VEGIAGWGIGGPVRAYLTRVGRLEFGGIVVDWPVTRLTEAQHGFFTSRSIAGNIGYGVFSRFTVTFDYARKRMIFEPGADSEHRDVYDRSGMWLVRKGDRFTVADVIAGGPAADAGVRVGDAVTAVDGRAAPDVSLASVREMLRGQPGTTIALHIVHAGKPADVNVTLRDLV
jgi:hypothetical protein